MSLSKFRILRSSIWANTTSRRFSWWSNVSTSIRSIWFRSSFRRSGSSNSFAWPAFKTSSSCPSILTNKYRLRSSICPFTSASSIYSRKISISSPILSNSISNLHRGLTWRLSSCRCIILESWRSWGSIGCWCKIRRNWTSSGFFWTTFFRIQSKRLSNLSSTCLSSLKYILRIYW